MGGCCQGCQDVPRAPDGGVTGLTDLWFLTSPFLPSLKMFPFQGTEPPCWSLLQVALLAACPLSSLGVVGQEAGRTERHPPKGGVGEGLWGCSKPLAGAQLCWAEGTHRG